MIVSQKNDVRKEGYKKHFVAFAICVVLSVFWSLLPLTGWIDYKIQADIIVIYQLTGLSAANISFMVIVGLFAAGPSINIMIYMNMKSIKIVRVF